MDFFEAQDQARQRTGLLVFLFVLAVLVLVAMTNVLVMGALVLWDKNPAPLTQPLAAWFDWGLFASVSGGVVAVVALGTAWKLAALSSGGGRGVAEGLGGKLVPRDTDDPDLKRVLNVVEEMAIASGTPVPPVYVLPREKGINAFAAGFAPGDAVIGVTRGTALQLSRDQLQAVVAHEFSHVLNGDMRLNLRLMGVTHGILVIGLIGQQLLRSMRFTAGRRGRGGGGGPVMLVGLGLMAVGYGGTFFGNLIKAAVGRQREFLADAAAVQFTRNPGALAGALKRIGGLTWGSALHTPAAPEFSHAMFGEGVETLFGMLFSTHPPLAARIRRVEPRWDGAFDTSPPRPDPREAEGPVRGRDGRQVARVLGAAAVAAASVSTVGAVRRVGQPSEAHIARARELLGRIPDPIREAAAEPYGARAVIYGLLCEGDAEMLERQFAHLDAHGDTGLGALTRRLHPEVTALAADLRLPAVDLALPALQQLSAPQEALFRANLKALMAMDRKLSLFEWSLSKVLTHHLGRGGARRPMRDGSLHIANARAACAVLLSALARAGKGPAEAAFDAAMPYVQLPGLALLPGEEADLKAVDRAVDRLGALGAFHKRRLLKGCIACIQADGVVTAAQGELVRAISDAIGCPMPPLVGE